MLESAEKKVEKKGNLLALLPIAVFLAVYIGIGIIYDDFYVMSVVVAFLIAIFVACCQNRKVKFDEKIKIMASGIGDKNILTMILIFLAAGIFAGTLGKDSADSVANLLLGFIPARYSALILFVVACFVSTAMGTSCGTIVVIGPIACALAGKTGVSLALCMASVVGGSMFGDNLSFISDTTIAATSTQGCKMRDKFKMNFLIALPAAIITIIILVVMAVTSGVDATYEPKDPDLVLLIPYILVLIGGICGINVFIVLLGGIVTSLIIKLALGVKFMEILVSMGGGATGMFEVIMVTVLVSMLSALMKSYGGFDALLYGIRKVFKGKVGGQLGISTLVAVMDVATANNTVAIVMTAPIAKEISTEYGISPKRTASLLDIFGSIVQGIIPYGAQMIYATTAITVAFEAGVITETISAGQIIPFLFYPYILTLCAVVSMLIVSRKENNEPEYERLTIDQADEFMKEDDYEEDLFQPSDKHTETGGNIMRRYYISDENHKFVPLMENKNVPDSGDGLFSLFLNLWTEETCAPRLRGEWSQENPTAGQCSITAFVLQDVFGGEVYGVPLDGGGYHSFNYIDGVYLDLACEQFHGKALDFTLNFPQSREEHFASEEKYQRYLLLKEGFDKLTK